MVKYQPLIHSNMHLIAIASAHHLIPETVPCLHSDMLLTFQRYYVNSYEGRHCMPVLMRRILVITTGRAGMIGLTSGATSRIEIYGYYNHDIGYVLKWKCWSKQIYIYLLLYVMQQFINFKICACYTGHICFDSTTWDRNGSLAPVVGALQVWQFIMLTYSVDKISMAMLEYFSTCKNTCIDNVGRLFLECLEHV